MLGSCNRCGACCEAIQIGRENTPDRIAKLVIEHVPGRNLEFVQDMRFIFDHWHPISFEEAMRRLGRVGSVPEDVPSDLPFYECDQYDPLTKLCTAHDTRPPVCRNFPWYGHPPDVHRLGFTPLSCGYRTDVMPLVVLEEWKPWLAHNGQVMAAERQVRAAVSTNEWFCAFATDQEWALDFHEGERP